MDDKKTTAILMRLLEKNILNEDEKEALKAAIGTLSWTALAGSRLKKQKDKRDKSVKW